MALATESSRDGVVRIDQYEEGALARASGFHLQQAVFDDRRGRVALLFADPAGDLKALLTTHRAAGVEINSLDLIDGLNWAKSRIFDVRRERLRLADRTVTASQ
jgi:hypothetical protein